METRFYIKTQMLHYYMPNVENIFFVYKDVIQE